MCRAGGKPDVLSDKGISTAALQWPPKSRWPAKVEQNSKACVLDKDLVHLEASTRDATAIMSDLGAFVAAICSALEEHGVAAPFVQRALCHIGTAIADWSKLLIDMMH